MTSEAQSAVTGPFSAWMEARRVRVEQALEAVLPGVALLPGRLHEAMRYATLGGGKRMRPLLAFAAGEDARRHFDTIVTFRMGAKAT